MEVDQQAWDADIIVGAAEIMYKGTMFTATPGTGMPTLHTEPRRSKPGDPWGWLAQHKHCSQKVELRV